MAGTSPATTGERGKCLNLTRFVREEYEKYGRLVKDLNIKAEYSNEVER